MPDAGTACAIWTLSAKIGIGNFDIGFTKIYTYRCAAKGILSTKVFGNVP